MKYCYYSFLLFISFALLLMQSVSGGSLTPRFGFPVLQTQVVGNQTMSPTDMANQLLQSLPVIKLGLLSSVSTFLAPILQGLLITALILFALTGTASIICQMVDCSAVLGQGNHGGGGFLSATHINPIVGFHHQNLHNPIPAMNTFPRRRDIQRKHWLTQPIVPTMKDFEETLDKYGDK